MLLLQLSFRSLYSCVEPRGDNVSCYYPQAVCCNRRSSVVEPRKDNDFIDDYSDYSDRKKSTSKSKTIKQIDKTWQVIDFKMKLHMAKKNVRLMEFLSKIFC